MKAVGAFFILIAVACVYAQMNDDEDWDDFKQEHGLRFESEEKDKLRKLRFNQAKKKVNDHNAKNKGKKGVAKLRMHPIALLSDEEFAQKKLGLIPNKKNVTIDFQAASPSLTQLPASFDWRQYGAVTPVQNQGSCGSCWAFSAAGALEGAWFRKYGKLINLSEQQLMDCSGMACGGGWMNSAFDYVRNQGGLDTDCSYPYTAVQGTCKYDCATIGAKCSGYVNVAWDEASIKTALVNNGPLAIAIGVSGNSGLYSTGIFASNMCVTSINHGVLLVGYGQDASGNKFWIIKNSWGTGWGMAGYFNYPIGSATCVVQYPSYPLVP